MTLLSQGRILGKYEAVYYHCEESGLILTPNPTWLTEAYSSAIASLDVGLVSRNLHNRDQTAWVLSFLGLNRGPYVDVGGGYGLFTRLMRDEGYEFLTTDPYCKNLFAPDFEPRPGVSAEAITAFEVFEHISDPLGFLTQRFSEYGCRTVVFSTLLYGDRPPPPDWWYWCMETGQHITFYNRRSLELLAQKLGGHTFSLNEQFHVITDRPLTRLQKLILEHRTVRRAYNRLTRNRQRRPGLIMSDFEAIRSRLRIAQGASTADLPAAVPR